MAYKDKEKQKEYDRTYSKRYYAEHKSDVDKKYKERYERCKLKNICYRCGSKIEGLHTLCNPCRTKKSLHSYRYRNKPGCTKKSLEVTHTRGERYLKEGRCYKCGRPLMDEVKFCIACQISRTKWNEWK